MAYRHFEFIEKHAWTLGILTAVMVSLGGLAEILPTFVEANRVKLAAGGKPYDPLRLAGRDIYVREGCYLCHSQMIRALRFETQRYGRFSTAEESIYDRPFQWGSKRTGPDLARVGGKYSDDWQRLHLMDPRTVVPQSNMPGYPWLATARVDGADIAARLRTLRTLGDPYTEADIAGAAKEVDGKTELEALVAYLQGLGIANEPQTAPPAAAAAAPIAGSSP
ncbi:MAG: peptidase S41 [Bacteroidota bacterium]|jgi:cytochrome c oxidase cbb3-type subunit 2|uniref:Cytochrome-c oxidase, cbb3-type subunit II n=1 Tax=Candidatus Desulfobacillus denitrificans TaxID=2608985 RepID=A0A809R3T7_9PROT|nr:MAG: cytochrome-c oxidase, cbb3-type subunit II [Rhodocyclaceae bacterium UTPRO2]BBO22199.1 cytochrome-c oxidase, cbb3-type subunit II [Candidatus Desulfobacillus denitrificans]GIK70913.1 MAG: peptidase S41 [Bacteroidota bacterium]GJQ54614.1 MAG: peptidase S41 [Rhodocyclaceae bacterium]